MLLVFPVHFNFLDNRSRREKEEKEVQEYLKMS